MYQETLNKWHEMLAQRDPSQLASILSEDVIFYSPVVFTPQKGKKITSLYLTGAFHVLVGGGHFKYLKETFSESTAILEFQTQVDDVTINGVDIITFDAAGLVKEFKVMVRPLQGMQALHQKMGELLERLSA